MALRRLAYGALAGLVLGVALGLGFALGLGWGTTTGLLSMLISGGAGATAAAIIGKPAWEHSGLLESALRMVIGVVLGVGLVFVASRFLSWTVPFALLGAPADTRWHEMPPLYVPLVTTLYGALLGLEAGGGAARGSKPGRKPPPPPPRIPGLEKP